MSRSEIDSDIRETLGQIPEFFARMPDAALEHEWAEFKRFQIEDTELTIREKELIGFGVAAAIHCPYCTYFHRSSAQMMGVSDEQIEEAARVAADTVKFSTYMHALEIDLESFKRMADEIGEYVSSQQGSGEAEPGGTLPDRGTVEETLSELREAS
jgi:AhpD family alkylhydroperoxidase